MSNSKLRKLDIFAKTRPDLQQRSVAGGIITVVASTTAVVLLIGQLAFYISGSSQHSLHLARSIHVPLTPLNRFSTKGRVPLHIHITFPHLQCDKIDVNFDGASLSSGELEKVHGKHSLVLRNPNSYDTMASGIPPKGSKGCTIIGKLNPRIVAGVLAISLNRDTWVQATQFVTLRAGADESSIAEQLQKFNVSHFIHNIQFGDIEPLEKPLKNRAHWIENAFGGVAVEHIQVKLVPTLVSGSFSETFVYQMSVVDHTINPTTLVTRGVPHLPGLVMSYDFTPLAVWQSSGRDNIFVFLSSLISIVGGVFVTVGLLTGCLVHSAQAVAKKID